MPPNPWPFDQPPEAHVITLRSIILGGSPVLRVTHDLDEGWQFLGLGDADVADAAIVRLQDIVARDPSVSELASMPLGWHAFRKTLQSPWTVEPDPHAHD